MKGHLEKHAQLEALDQQSALRAQLRRELLERVFKAVRVNGGGDRQIAENAHVKPGVVRSVLKELVAAGRVRRVDTGEPPRWNRPRWVYEAT